MNKKMKRFKLFGKDFGFTYVGDKTSMYGFNSCIAIVDGVAIPNKKKPEYYHKICLGLYRKSDSWLS